MRKETAWARARGVGGGKSAAAYGVDEEALRGQALRDGPAFELLVERLGALRLRGQHRAEQVALVQLMFGPEGSENLADSELLLVVVWDL